MSKKNFFAILGLLGLGAYVTRRQWLGKILRLAPAKYSVTVERGVAIPMPDGVRLIADHYAPKSNKSFPTILARTPYGRNQAGGVLGLLHVFFAQRLAERGYHVIFQDMRGRFDSEGVFEPFVDETRDGVATLAWIAAQPWFDGHVGMWGQSYEGYAQWAVAAAAPGFLQALVPSIAGTEITPFVGSGFTFDGIARWMMILTRAGSGIKMLAADFIRYIYPAPLNRQLARAFDELPVGQADERALGKPVDYFRKWLLPENAHSEAPFWKAVAHGVRMNEVRAATHIVAGWYDIFLDQTLRDYAAMRAAGHTPYLTIGPWKHLDLACVAETLRASIDWYDAQLKGRRRKLRVKPIRIYLMGANRWLEYDEWSPFAQPTRLYLGSQRHLSTDAPMANIAPDIYRYDPAQPTPALGGPLYQPAAGAVDNRPLEARDDVLTFTTPPLENDVDVIGRVQLELFARSSTPSADFFARLCDVYSDGRSINLCDGGIRIDTGMGDHQADGSLRVVIDMWATANRFMRGHRIRLSVMSGQHPRLARNLGTGEPVATATRMIVAEQTIYHDAAHPSALVLPVIGDAV